MFIMPYFDKNKDINPTINPIKISNIEKLDNILDSSNEIENFNLSNEIENFDLSNEIENFDSSNEIENFDSFNEIENFDSSNEIENFNNNSDISKIDMNKCDKSCCKHSQWMPSYMTSSPNSNNNYIGSNYSCNGGNGSGCVCMTKDNLNFLTNRGYN